MTAESMAALAAETAVSKPKDLSISGMSLSIVFGTTATHRLLPLPERHQKNRHCLLSNSAQRIPAPRMVPSPPTMKRASTFARSSASAIAVTSPGPLCMKSFNQRTAACAEDGAAERVD